VLCPALPEVQEFHKKLTEQFIGEWALTGTNWNNIYTVPACYNPKHHHKSPQDSINAMADVLQNHLPDDTRHEARQRYANLPCGTTPNLACWVLWIKRFTRTCRRGAGASPHQVYKALRGPRLRFMATTWSYRI